MRNVKKLVAALLALALVLTMTGVAFASSPKFTRDDTGSDASVYAKFQGNLYAYNKHSASSKSSIIVKKGSTAKVVGVYGKKWVQLQITSGLSKDKKMWFGVDKLARVTKEREMYIHVIFSFGGSGLSKQVDQDYSKELKGKKIKTTGKVNLRKYASLQGSSKGTVKKGTKLTLTGRYGWDTRGVNFLQVKYKGNKYFISQEYTNLKGKWDWGE